MENEVVEKITSGTLRLIVPFNIIKIDNKNFREEHIEDNYMFHIGRDILLSGTHTIDMNKSIDDYVTFDKIDDTIDTIKHLKLYSVIYIKRVQSGGLVLTFENDWVVNDYEVFHDVRLHSMCVKIIKDFMKLQNDKVVIEEPFAYFNESDDNYKDEFDFIRSFNETKLKNIKTVLNDKNKNIVDMESKMKILNDGSTFLFISIDGLWLSLNTKRDYAPESKWIDHNTVAYNIVFYTIYNNIYNGENSRELSNLIINRENINSTQRHNKLAKILSNNVIGILLARIIDIDSCCDYFNSRSIISEPIKEIKRIVREENDYAYDVIECIKNEICPFSQSEYEELIDTFIQFNTERDNLESQKLQRLLNNLTAVNLVVQMSDIGFITLVEQFNHNITFLFSLLFVISTIILSFKPIILIYKDYLED